MRLGRTFVGMAFVLAALPAGATGDEAADAPLLWGQPAQREHCPDAPGFAWATGDGAPSCLRYFASAGIDGAELAIVMLHGDRNRLMGKPPGDIPLNTARRRQAMARRHAERLGRPVILLARPGVYGSSGDHRHRRRRAEFTAINQALDLIRLRYNIRRLVLVGHSGGATAAAATLTMGRADVACAVLTSGAYDLVERQQIRRKRDGRPPLTPEAASRAASRVYDPIQHIDGVRRDPARRIVILGDPDDVVTPYALQLRFANRLADAGHAVTVREVAGKPPEHHDLNSAAVFAAIRACAGT